MCQINFYLQKNFLIMFAFILSIQRWKGIVTGFPPLYQNKLQEQGIQDVVNTNKIKFEPYGDLVDKAYLNLMRPWLTIKTHKAKLKMTKHQGQNILMKVIQKTEKQTKLQQLPTLCQKYYRIMKSHRAKESLQCSSYMD